MLSQSIERERERERIVQPTHLIVYHLLCLEIHVSATDTHRSHDHPTRRDLHGGLLSLIDSDRLPR